MAGRLRPRAVLVAALLLTLANVSLVVFAYRDSRSNPPFARLRELQTNWVGRGSVDAPVLPHTREELDLLLTIRAPEEIADRRSRLASLIWGGEGLLPERLPDRVESGIEDPRFTGLPGLARIDRLLVEMPYGLTSELYHFHAEREDGPPVLYHEGHGSDFSRRRDVIRALLSSGRSVIALSMPLNGRNNRPVVRTRRFGAFRVHRHDQLKLLDEMPGHPVRFFLDPVVAAVNHAEAEHGHPAVHMVGLSGGGWTTVLAAALDDRIGRSVSVAGTYPIFVRSRSRRDWGDWEETLPEVYSIANYLELYVMGSHGEGRRLLMIVNEHDPCCHGGREYELFEGVVRDRVAALGPGSFDVFLDEGHRRHRISRKALGRIIQELGGAEKLR
jgi:hypothetical protein